MLKCIAAAWPSLPLRAPGSHVPWRVPGHLQICRRATSLQKPCWSVSKSSQRAIPAVRASGARPRASSHRALLGQPTVETASACEQSTEVLLVGLALAAATLGLVKAVGPEAMSTMVSRTAAARRARVRRCPC